MSFDLLHFYLTNAILKVAGDLFSRANSWMSVIFEIRVKNICTTLTVTLILLLRFRIHYFLVSNKKNCEEGET